MLLVKRFHDPDERDPDILRLRELHAAMDRAVLDEKPWRYRWPDDVRDDVLARLLDLNQTRHKEEVAAGLHDKGGAKGAKAGGEGQAAPKPRGKKAPKGGESLSLFGDGNTAGSGLDRDEKRR